MGRIFNKIKRWFRLWIKFGDGLYADDTIISNDMENGPKEKITIGNLTFMVHKDQWWTIGFPNGSELQGIGNPFTSPAFNSIREEFMNDVGRRNCKWLRQMFDEHYSK